MDENIIKDINENKTKTISYAIKYKEIFFWWK